MIDFVPMPKIPRFNRGAVITEKIDGTNASIYIGDGGEFLVGSRNRWITPDNDNYGFARWAHEHKDELLTLGPGHHFGEWWGAGIQRRYGLNEKRFSLFNTSRWGDMSELKRPSCCHVVPVICGGRLSSEVVDEALARLRSGGSLAAPGFMQPEGVVVFHEASRSFFKATLDNDEMSKGEAARIAEWITAQ